MEDCDCKIDHHPIEEVPISLGLYNNIMGASLGLFFRDLGFKGMSNLIIFLT